MAANTYDVRSAVQQLANALLGDVERIAELSVTRMRELLPSYANVPADALMPVLLTNTRNLLEAVRDQEADHSRTDDHFQLSGETRLSQGITADEMLQAWRIGLEVVREEAHPVAKRLEATDAVLLEFVEATLQWGDIGMRRSAAAHREGEFRELERLAAEQAALRRVAMMVARESPPEEVFAGVAEELGRLLAVEMVRMIRFEPDGTATVLAAHGITDDRLTPGTNLPIPEGSVIEKVFRTGGPARVDDFAEVHGPVGAILREQGAGAGVGGPIVVDGRLWGAMAVGSRSAEALPPGCEDRVAQFAELVSTAISNLESRTKVERLAAEQAALRGVAELVARQASAERIFAVVTEELGRLLEVDMVRTVRFEPDGTATILAARGGPEDLLPAGSNTPRPGGGILDQVFRTGHPGRVDDYGRVTGPLAVAVRDHGICSAVAGPIVVNGRTWGAMAVGSQRSLPVGIEDRVGQFAELVSTAISNIESRGEVERLAAEQAALRRVAELVAQHAPPEQVFALVTEELNRLLDVTTVGTGRFEPDGTVTIMAVRGTAQEAFPPGTRVALEGGSAIEQVYRTGRPAHIENYDGVGGQLGAVMREVGAGWAAAGPIVVDGRLWGAMTVNSGSPGAYPAGTEQRVAKFTELVSTAISNIESTAKVERLAAEQSALRRVATLVARTPASEQLFSTVAREVASVLDVPGVIVTRYDADGMALTLGEAFRPDLAGAERFLGVGARMPRDPGSLAAQVFDTHGPARVDDFSTLPGTVGDLTRAARLGSGCASPIVVNGSVWGKMCVFSRAGTVLPAGMENRLHDFIELLATAIANYESRASVERLAAEQSALRRVATLVAREHSPDELFAAVVEELGVLLEVDATAILRYEADSSATVVAGWSDGAITLPVGARFPLEGENLAGEVRSTGKARRKQDYEAAPGPIAATVRELGIRSAVASPIVVEGVTWGVIAVLSRKPEAFPPDTEARIAEFTRQASLAVANARSRSDLADSRARIVRAGDDARRRFERDLHDGAQQRLVSLGLELRAAEATVPPELGALQERLSRLGSGLNDVLDDLRELSRGLHPAVLSEDGLTPALGSLALRSAVPVDVRLDVGTARFEEPVEVAAYYVAAEALTNTAKHAEASRALLSARRCDGWLELTVSDDGRGGADASSGSGLTGLVDRVEAIGGSMEIESQLGRGTSIRVRLPVSRASG